MPDRSSRSTPSLDFAGSPQSPALCRVPSPDCLDIRCSQTEMPTLDDNTVLNVMNGRKEGKKEMFYLTTHEHIFNTVI